MTTVLKTKAWIAPYSSFGPEDLKSLKDLSGISFALHDMSDSGWTFIGEASVTIDLVNADQLVDNKVKSLRAEVKQIRAESTARITKIEGKIQQLLCIELSPA